MEFTHRLHRALIRMRLQPIRVYCFHHVSAEYNPLTMWKCDWTQIDQFKHNIMHLKASGVEFISLTVAHEKLSHDWIRRKRYAVLTADDGYKSLLNIVQWLEENKIPITLFVNSKYLDGKSWSAINEEQARRAKPDVDMMKDVCPTLYLTQEELKQVAAMTNVTIGMHGHEHLDATKQTIGDFKTNVEKCQEMLMDVPNTISYFAYTWGNNSDATDKLLRKLGITPVLVSRNLNYNNTDYIDRIAIDGKYESDF